jgi:hypothetical protein
MARARPDASESPCECGELGKRTLPKSVNVALSGGTVDLTKDTGLSGIDYNFDRAVGESSKKNWRGIAQRQRSKLDVIRANNVTGWDLSKNTDGTYRVMNSEERAASERSREFHFKAVKQGKDKGLLK